MEFTVSGPKRAWLGKYVETISWLQEKPPVATMIFFARISTVLLFFSSLKRTPMGAPSPSTMKFVARRFSLYVAPFCSKPFCSGVSTACMSPMPLPGNSMDVVRPFGLVDVDVVLVVHVVGLALFLEHGQELLPHLLGVALDAGVFLHF